MNEYVEVAVMVAVALLGLWLIRWVNMTITRKFIQKELDSDAFITAAQYLLVNGEHILLTTARNGEILVVKTAHEPTTDMVYVRQAMSPYYRRKFYQIELSDGTRVNATVV